MMILLWAIGSLVYMSTDIFVSSAGVSEGSQHSLAGARPGEERVIAGMRFCWIPSGKFRMGSPPTEKLRGGNEGQVDAEVSGFWMAKFETSQKEWERVMGANPSFHTSPNLPVERVNWLDAKIFLQRLSSKIDDRYLLEGWQLRLPTEAEWEFACRGGTTTPFYWGESANGEKANVKGGIPYGDAQSGPQFDRPTVVGFYERKAPHPWGLCDMHGNVFEWCLDNYNYKDKLPGGKDPLALQEGNTEYRVCRGGSFGSFPSWSRAAYRMGAFQSGWNGTSHFGLRAVLSPIEHETDGAELKAELSRRRKEIEKEVLNYEKAQSTDPVVPQDPRLSGNHAGEERLIAGIKFCWIPGGQFKMGSPVNGEDRAGDVDDEQDHNADRVETEVSGFWMAKYETSQVEWERVMDRNESQVKGGNLPVERVNWLGANSYTRKLESRLVEEYIRAGWKVRLPTEAEWEFACRAGTTTPFYWGENANGERANIDGRSPYGDAEKGPYLRRTSPVGSYELAAPHPWGLCDMHGNVLEWCLDGWFDYQLLGGKDPLNRRVGSSFPVVRGGSWACTALDCRVGVRGQFYPDLGRQNIGFRPVLSPLRLPGDVRLKAEIELQKYEMALSDWPEDPQDAKDLTGIQSGEERLIAGLKFCWIPGGKFKMGSPTSEGEREDDEKQVDVEVSGFWMAKYEISQREWEEIVEPNPSEFKGPNLPVEQVDWNGAHIYMDGLMTQLEDEFRTEGWHLRLPTEAEWEFACRAGTTTPFYWGESANGQKANLNGSTPYGDAEKGPYLRRTSPVGSYEKVAPHPWGLCDMHGNVLEWCLGHYQKELPEGRNPLVRPEGVVEYRIYRGGCFIFSASDCRAASRRTTSEAYNLGLRPVLSQVKHFTGETP